MKLLFTKQLTYRKKKDVSLKKQEERKNGLDGTVYIDSLLVAAAS